MTFFPYNNYADGAPVSTAGKPQYDGNIDIYDSSFPSKMRKQLHWLNVNNTDIPTLLTSATSRTIGVGINIQVESTDHKFNSSAESFLEEFNLLGIGELTNKHHFNSAMRALSNFELLDGGVIIRHHYHTAWEIPYKYELVGVDMVNSAKSTFLPDPQGRVTVAGMVLNKWSQIEAVWLYTDVRKRQSELVPIKNLTYYSEVWVSLAQQMAVSKLTTLLPTLDRIDQYSKAELTSAIESAKGGAYLQSTAYAEILEIAFEKIRATGTSETQTTEIYNILRSLSTTGVKPTGLTPIPSGDNVIFPTQTRDGIYEALNSTAETKMASSQGQSAISAYSQAEKANYSAIKFAAGMDQLSANIRFDNISSKVIQEIISRAIQVGVQIGRIPSRAQYWANPKAFNRFSYLRNIDVDIEPSKTAMANKLNLELGLKTKKEIVEQRTGRKYEDFLNDKIDSEIFEIQLRREKFIAAGLPDPILGIATEIGVPQ